MDVTQEILQRNSEEEFRQSLSTYVDSGTAVIHVRTGEVMRCLLALRRQALTGRNEYHEWDVVNGFRQFSLEDMSSITKKGDGNIDISSAFSEPMNAIDSYREERMRYYVFVNPHVFMESNPHMSHLVMHYASVLPATNICVVMVTPDIPLPGDVPVDLLSLTFDPPGLSELQDTLADVLDGVKEGFDGGAEMTEEDIERVCYVGAGMTAHSFETYASLAAIRAAREGKDTLTADDIIKGVTVGKTDVVNANDILELYPSTSIDNVGGMENLKSWVHKRAGCYSDKAKEFGVEPPKGMVLVGPPGTGKSLVAKAVSSVLGVPLVRLDFGRVFNSLVGASEERMRVALHMVEKMAPVVIFCDEIDKGLGGIGGSGDSGVSSRVLGTFLTWLNDCKYPVFTIMTANNVTGLPPELLRRGRFDAIFSTSLPTPRERTEVLRIHLGLRGRDISTFDSEDTARVVSMLEGYVPAEIESAVKDALVDAFSDGVELEMSHIEKAAKAMVPLSVAFKAQIETMNEWAKNNATPVSRDDSETAAALQLNRRRVLNRSRSK